MGGEYTWAGGKLPTKDKELHSMLCVVVHMNLPAVRISSLRCGLPLPEACARKAPSDIRGTRYTMETVLCEMYIYILLVVPIHWPLSPYPFLRKEMVIALPYPIYLYFQYVEYSMYNSLTLCSHFMCSLRLPHFPPGSESRERPAEEVVQRQPTVYASPIPFSQPLPKGSIVGEDNQ